ncbi:MAG: glycoside hydrolase family 3 C-terminal domain-containing protein, partial [Candidatus Acidiferrales bacterium]
VVVLGPDAWPTVTGGGGSSIVTPFTSVGILDGLNQMGGLKVLYARGIPTLEELFEGTTLTAVDSGKPAPARSGDENIKVETFANDHFSGKPESVAYVSNIDSWHPRVWGSGGASHRSVRWSGTYLPQSTGSYLFVVAATATDAYKLYVNGKVVVEESRHESQAPHSAEFNLTAGQPASIRLDYQPGGQEEFIGMGIRAMSDLISPDARQIAARADAAIVSVGFDSSNESEGFDRSYALPYGQDALIEAVRAANKYTIVVLTSGGDVDTHRWIAKVPAFLHNWYPGQEGGAALAEILVGARSPEGKLPISFPVSWEQNPVHDHYYPPPTPAGQTPHVKYTEGVFLGYRYFTSTNEKPLFPFGFGLSYTTFSFSNLVVTPQATSDDQVSVSFDVANTGARAGAEVAQLYVGDPSAKVKRPAKELKGFEKVRLDPGQSRRVTFSLNKRSLAYWDEASHGWRVDPGKFVVYAGDSSENTPLTADFTVSAK